MLSSNDYHTPPVIMFSDIMAKFNPYHDGRGRFASANGAASFTYKPGQGAMYDRAIERDKKRTASPDKRNDVRGAIITDSYGRKHKYVTVAGTTDTVMDTDTLERMKLNGGIKALIERGAKPYTQGEYEDDTQARAERRRNTPDYELHVGQGRATGTVGRGKVIRPGRNFTTAKMLGRNIDVTLSELLAKFNPYHDRRGAGTFTIAKTEDDEQLVFGWASVAVDKQGRQLVDWQGDMIDPADLERTAYDHVLNFRAAGERHDPALRGKGELVESVAFTPEKRAAMGVPDGAVPDGWWVGYHITDPETWRKIKSGEYKMFSIDGFCEREEVSKVAPVVMFRDIIAKFNMYHDRRGRFAHAPDRGGPGAASVSSKQQKRINEFKKRLRTGEINTNLRYKDGINKHDPSSVEYGRHAQLRAKMNKRPPSYFEVKPESLCDEISRKLKRKDLMVTFHGGNEMHAHVELDNAVGVSYDSQRNPFRTNKVTVVFSERDGMHYYPDEEET